MTLEQGISYTLKETVTKELSAKVLGSGSLMVYGTPAMLLLVEKTAVAMLEGKLDDGMTSVGTNLNVDHVAASPIGCEVRATLTLKEIDKRRLLFDVLVEDPAGVIGRGSHERFIVNADKFQAKTDSKLL